MDKKVKNDNCLFVRPEIEKLAANMFKFCVKWNEQNLDGCMNEKQKHEGLISCEWAHEREREKGAETDKEI